MHEDRPHTARRIALAALALIAVLLFSALGIWQIERRAWKLALIEAVDTRVAAPATAAPPPLAWPRVSTAADQYRHVFVQGRLLNDRETLVQTVTERGEGYWVVTPLRTAAGAIILVNRGFVPADRADRRLRAAGLPTGIVRVTGLLRMSEPGGRLLRGNRPAEDRWYSRDVAAIAHARGFDAAAPFFIDADDAPNPGGWPLGGLTIVAFPNNHLVYALTWFGLAALCAWAAAYTLRAPGRSRETRPGDGPAAPDTAPPPAAPAA